MDTRAGTINYPDSDGQTTAESDVHARETQECVLDVLRDQFADDADVDFSGRRPRIVIEITSRKTRGDDRGRKREIYARRLAVHESPNGRS